MPDDCRKCEDAQSTPMKNVWWCHAPDPDFVFEDKPFRACEQLVIKYDVLGRISAVHPPKGWVCPKEKKVSLR